MASSNERLKVAASLRDEAAGFRRIEKEYGHEPTIDLGDSPAVLQDVAHFAGLDGAVRTYALFDRLSDLIDPTCEVVMEGPDGYAGEFVAQMFGTVCSECGGDLHRDRFTGAYPAYCPHCGARVVADER